VVAQCSLTSRNAGDLRQVPNSASTTERVRPSQARQLKYRSAASQLPKFLVRRRGERMVGHEQFEPGNRYLGRDDPPSRYWGPSLQIAVAFVA
jgi:hypothetical protein